MNYEEIKPQMGGERSQCLGQKEIHLVPFNCEELKSSRRRREKWKDSDLKNCYQ